MADKPGCRVDGETPKGPPEDVCADPAADGSARPLSWFARGRRKLLLGQTYDALGWYARGIRHCLDGRHGVPADLLEEEKDRLRDAQRGGKESAPFRYAIDLLSLGQEAGKGSGSPPGDTAVKAPVVIVAGGAGSMDEEAVRRVRPLLRTGLADFGGTVISGGTSVGVPGCVGEIARELAGKGARKFTLLGYLPVRVPPGAAVHPGYDRITALGEDFLPDQILGYWNDILKAGVPPGDVYLLGLGGGELSALEYRVALGLGARVGIVASEGGAGKEMLRDPLWTSDPDLLPLPFDPAAVRAFVMPPGRSPVPGKEPG